MLEKKCVNAVYAARQHRKRQKTQNKSDKSPYLFNPQLLNIWVLQKTINAAGMALRMVIAIRNETLYHLHKAAAAILFNSAKPRSALSCRPDITFRSSIVVVLFFFNLIKNIVLGCGTGARPKRQCRFLPLDSL